MKKLVAVFLLAVLIPSLILAWLAVRSLRDQELVVEQQRALLHQSTTDSLAADVNIFMDDIRLYFRNVVDELLAESGVDGAAVNFDEMIRSRWAQVEVGAVVSENGELISPSTASTDQRIQVFCADIGPFLTNRDVAEVYAAAPQTANTIAVDLEEAPPVQARLEKPAADAKESASANEAAAMKEKVSVYGGKLSSRITEKKQGHATAQLESNQSLRARNIVPLSQSMEQQQALQDDAKGQFYGNPWSMLVTQRGEFRELIGDEEEGAFSRFLQNRLHVLVWYRPSEFAGRIFCAQLDLDMLKNEIGKIVSEYQPSSGENRSSGWDRSTSGQDGVCLAIIDETGQAISTSVSGFSTRWGKTFVATEVGEILPHWEVAAYLINPGALNRAASSFRFTLGLMIVVLIAAIGLGSLLIFLDLARQTKLARQKTDFVSNVSHELKTPLTSIRMFSDLLSGESAAAAEKRGEYAGIISSEAARLTRLINNLLDFSRLERGDQKYEHERLDLGALVKETVDHYRAHLQAKGITLAFDFDTESRGPIEVEGDHDALAQVLLNLISNAEKYGGDGKEITVGIETLDGVAEIRVMDRGDGVSRKDQDRIFKKFYRVDDSLSSGIQGSGLGLALARQIAQAHGGDVVYRNREGGGSCFVIVLPVAEGGRKVNQA